jgi:hypothetical protein
MKTCVVLIYLLVTTSQCFSYTPDAVMVGERMLVGDPQTLITLSKVSIGGHEIKLSRWQRKEEINQAMQTLTTQLPSDTLAWSDGEQLRMQWSTSEQSHLLVVYPVNKDLSTFYLSSIYLSGVDPKRQHASYVLLKQTLSDPTFRTKLLLDVRDDSTDLGATSLIYDSTLSIKILDKKVRDVLNNNNWFIVDVSKHQSRFQYSSSFEAMRNGEILRFDLIDDTGRSYLYVHLSGGKQP